MHPRRRTATSALAALVTFVTVTAAATLAVAPPAAAQPFPSKPIKLIVPFPPGGPTDLIGRAAAQLLQDALGQPVVVENRAGAGGTLGLQVLAKSPADGYTVGLTAITLATAPHLGPVPFDPLGDFTFISNMASMTPLIVANPALPAKDIRELVTYAKANPGRLSYGTPGIATVPHLAAEMLQGAAGIRLTHVPYKGASQQIQDLLAGATLLDFQSSLVLALPMVKAGKLKPIAVVTPERSPLLPDVPTVAESGYPNIHAAPWFGVGGPAGLPREVVVKMNEAIVNGMKQKDVLDRFLGIGATVHTSTPEQFAAFVKTEHARWGDVIRKANIKAE